MAVLSMQVDYVQAHLRPMLIYTYEYMFRLAEPDRRSSGVHAAVFTGGKLQEWI